MKVVCKIIIILGLLFLPFSMRAQKLALSSNIIDYINLGTLNAEGAYAFSRHFTVEASFKYNPFEFNKGNSDKQFQNKTQNYSLGLRYWPWNVYSGWWMSSNMQYQEYNFGGLFSKKTQEGNRIGLSLGAGYTYMLTKHLNIDFGIKLWGGWDKFTKYDCPLCGLTMDKGSRLFFLPNEAIVAISYVF